MKKQHGFILPLTVMIVFTISALVIRLIREISLATPGDIIMHEREQAKAVALCGIDLMITQLAYSKKDVIQKRAFYEQLYKHLNCWNTYTLHKETDGIDAEFSIYVSCESGKIPINALWDFKNKKYVVKNQLNTKKIFESVILQKKDKDKSKDTPIAEGLETFFKNQKNGIEDITNLFTHEAFQGLSQPIFTQPLPEKNGQILFRPALGDLFTTATNELSIQPLFLSKTIGEIFGLKTEALADEEKREALIKQLSEMQNTTVDWSKQWDSLLAPIYDKKHASLTPTIQQLLNPAIGAYVISVVCYGKVGMVTQKIRVELIQSSKFDRVTYKISKYYWL